MPTTLEKKDVAGRWDTWEDVQRDPLLRDLPFKIETNEHGQVIMSPPAAQTSKVSETSEVFWEQVRRTS